MEKQLKVSSANGISVVVTCYNLERFIGASLSSVRDQQGAGAYEVIVVDDCSTDASAEIIQKFSNVQYIRAPSNGGVLRAMLIGVNEARFDTVALLDGDDTWEPEKLCQVRQAFAKDPAVAFVTHDLRFIDGDGRLVERTSLPKKVLGATPLGERGQKVRRGILDHADYVWLGSAFSFKREAANYREFADFVETLPDLANCYQDWPFAYWIAARPDVKLAYIDQPLFRYRLHRANHSGDARTLDRALRNFTRTRNTLDAIVKIADRFGVDPGSRKIVNDRLGLIQAQIDLYSGRRIPALIGFLRTVPLTLRTGEIKKEAIRFALGALLGPATLTKLVARGQ